MNDATLESRKAQARAWFQELQDKIIAGFEALEDECAGPYEAEAPITPGRFEKKAWTRDNHDGAPGGGGAIFHREAPRSALRGLLPRARQTENEPHAEAPAFVEVEHQVAHEQRTRWFVQEDVLLERWCPLDAFDPNPVHARNGALLWKRLVIEVTELPREPRSHEDASLRVALLGGLQEHPVEAVRGDEEANVPERVDRIRRVVVERERRVNDEAAVR